MGDFLLIIQVLVLVAFSAICSGLNVGIMSLQPADLKRKAKLGDKRAIRVLPYRKNSHLTISGIVFTNVALISATSLVLDTRLNGFVAGLLSTLLIVVFAEVLPQAWFSRYALSFCSRFAWLLRIMIVISYPISKPLQLMMDKILGHEQLLLHSRGELGMLIGEHLLPGASELDEDEVEIMKGALSLSTKQVGSIITPIDEVYWLTQNTLVDGGKINEIKTKGWSRIPIFDIDARKFYGILLMKDLVDVDFDEEPIYVEDLPLHTSAIVNGRTALDTMFRKFIAAKTHLMPVVSNNKIIGIVTIEDLLEEILGHEIEDESDTSRNLNGGESLHENASRKTNK